MIPEWLVSALIRWAVIVLVAGAFGATCFLKGIKYCEDKQDKAELSQRRENDAVLADNRSTQAGLQNQLDGALARLRRIQHACLTTPHPADVECVLNLRSNTKACP